MFNINIVKSQKNTKRSRSIITNLKSGEIKSVDFGSKRATTYYDGADGIKKKSYIARHGAPASNQDWTNIYSPSFWSRWVLWEHRKNEKDKIIETIKKNSKLPINKILFGNDFK
jgi:hypothetical protein